jgi:8-amino-7-oxononanoate synthase
MSRFDDDLCLQLSQRESDGLLRRVREVPARVLDLASNDYLGLSRDQSVIEAACDAARKYGAGARASRLVSGHNELHFLLESEIARFKKGESALLFSSGYAANIGVISALARRGDLLFCDKRNHASLIDACQFAQNNGATVRYYSTTQKLRALLQLNTTSSTRCADSHLFIVTDGVFSMDGDLCDWPQLVPLAREFGAVLILDDAHGTGTLGASGRGTKEHFSVENNGADIVEIGTLSKALGAQGGFVVGSQTLIDYLTNSSRSFVYSTALNPSACGAALASLRVLERESQRLQKLRDNTQILANGLSERGFDVTQQPSPILSVRIGDANRAVELSQKLLELGVWCPAIRPPTVPRNTSRLRVTASSALSQEDIARALAAFSALPKI